MPLNTFLTNVITSLLLVGLSAWIATTLALKRFRFEQLWIRKLDAYAALFEALSDIKSYSQAAVHELQNHCDMRETIKSQLSEKASIGHETIRKAIAVGVLVLSDETAKQLEIIQDDLSNPFYNLDLLEEMPKVVAITTKAIVDLQDLSKADLKRGGCPKFSRNLK